MTNRLWNFPTHLSAHFQSKKTAKSSTVTVVKTWTGRDKTLYDLQSINQSINPSINLHE